MVLKTLEYIIGTPDGCLKTGDIKPMPDGDERDPLLFLSVRGQPWRLRPTDAVEPDYSEELPKQW
eukprot:5354242-Amphidinium_carterae.1